MLTAPELLLLVILITALLVIVSNRLPPDLVALMLMLALGFTNLVKIEELFSGFSSSVVITLIGLFVITYALETTGVIQWIAARLNTLGANSETRLIFIFMLAGALFSLVMNNVAAGAMLLPAAVGVGRLSGVRLSKLLIPVSFGTLVGGMATYLTTANIVLSGILEKQGVPGLGMVDFVITGSPIVLMGLLFMLVIGRHWLPVRDTPGQSIVKQNLYDVYQLGERLWEIEILPTSSLVNTTLSESRIGEVLGLTVLAIWRGKQAIFLPTPDVALLAHDMLLVLGRQDRVEQLLQRQTALRQHHHHYDVDLIEVIIPPRSNAIGKNLTELNFRTRYGLTAVALWRAGRSYRTDVGKFKLQEGDALLMTGQFGQNNALIQDTDYLVPTSSLRPTPRYPQKAWVAVLITTVVLLIAILDILPLPEVMMTGAVLLVLTGCLTMPEAYKAMEWRVIFLVAGMLPISTAMIETGLAARVGTVLVDLLAVYGGLPLVAGLFLATVFITQVMGGQVTGLVIGPVAINAAISAGINPQAMAVAVAIGCSTAFITPVAHPVNILMMAPAGYTFGDFFKIGLAMTIITFLTLMVGMFVIWGVR